MILHIFEDLEITVPTVGLARQQAIAQHCLDTLEIADEVCKKFSIAHSFEGDEKSEVLSFSIQAQKITLDEFNVNTLFYTVFDSFLPVVIEYMSLGGTGCDMALSIRKMKVE